MDGRLESPRELELKGFEPVHVHNDVEAVAESFPSDGRRHWPRRPRTGRPRVEIEEKVALRFSQRRVGHGVVPCADALPVSAPSCRGRDTRPRGQGRAVRERSRGRDATGAPGARAMLVRHSTRWILAHTTTCTERNEGLVEAVTREDKRTAECASLRTGHELEPSATRANMPSSFPQSPS
jgi:hypothetical protein